MITGQCQFLRNSSPALLAGPETSEDRVAGRPLRTATASNVEEYEVRP